MPIQVTCPSCSGSFETDDSAAGKRARCPKCGGAIEIPGDVASEEILDAVADTPPLEAGESENTSDVVANRKNCPACGELIQRSAVKCRFCGEILDRSMMGILGSRAPDMHDPRWMKVRSGLATLYYSLLIIVICAILMMVAGGIGAAMDAGGPGPDPPAGMMVLFGLGALVVLGAAIAMLVGYVLCTNVPEVSGARGVMLGSVVCMVANIFISMLGQATGNPAIDLLGSIVSLVGSVLFILFLRRTANYLGNSQLAKSAGKFLIFCVGLLVSVFVIAFLAGMGQAEGAVLIVGLIAVVAALIAFVWYVNLIQGLMKTIDQRMGASWFEVEHTAQTYKRWQP